jgi:cytochrome c oxidase subunit II
MPPDLSSPSWLTPAGPAAAQIAGLTWVVFSGGAVIYLVVLGLLAYALWPRSRPAIDDNPATAAAGGDQRRLEVWLLGGGAIGTTLVLTALLLMSLRTFAAVLPPPDPAPLTVEIVGQQWWWAVRYIGAAPEDTVETANELHVPIGKPVVIRLLSTDVIHSFWVPELQGKLDLIPGKLNVTWLQADRPGVYRGQCAEYCGLQHARMGFLVIAQPAEDFAAWLRRERASAATPTDDLGRQGERLFLDRGCAFCHTIRGTSAFFGRGGPDLTHLASRRTLAAATLTNVGGHLAGWIANPQALKPGNRMPQVPLEPPEFHAVLHYLQGLR